MAPESMTRAAALGDVGAGGVRLGKHTVLRRGNAVAREKFLGEGLAGFELRGGARRAEHAQAVLQEFIHQAQRQRPFRPDHGEADGLGAHQLQQAGDVLGRHRDIAAARFARGAGITGRHQHLTHARRLRQLPRQGVFAPARTHHQNFHRSTIRQPKGRLG
jgi:hypothetical protein